jgi:small-conductance mechanosensitive channel
MDTPIFNLGSFSVSLRQLIFLAALYLIIGILYWLFSTKYSPGLFKRNNVTDKEKNRLRRIIKYIVLATFLLSFILVLKLDIQLFSSSSPYNFNISIIIKAFMIIQLARLFDWAISNIVVHGYFSNRDEKTTNDKNNPNKDSENSGVKIVQYIVYAVALIFLLRNFDLDFDLYPRTINGQKVNFKISNILFAILTLLGASFINWIMTQIVLYRVYKKKSVDIGGQFAINQLLKYVVYVIGFIIALQYLGIDMTLILGGAAALLVGIGLGLQQTFNDFFSGLVLLFERSVAVGDMLELESQRGVVKKIGLRSSIIQTRDNVSVIVPNSKLVNDNVTNWTHVDDTVRFKLDIGVAYGSDMDLIKKLLIKIAADNPYVINYPPPFVRFNAFGDSALDISLYIFSKNYMIIEDVKSDLLFDINRVFNENDIQIPFPQRDIRMYRSE